MRDTMARRPSALKERREFVAEQLHVNSRGGGLTVGEVAG
jgi:hypothetical protein